MTILLVIIAIAGLFGFGYYIMGRLDHFLEDNHKAIENPAEVVDPSCIMLTQDMSEEKINQEIAFFRQKHKDARIILCSGKENPFPKGRLLFMKHTRG